jgi:hypothetical protein
MRVADIKEILVQWEAGRTSSGIAAALGYSRPTVRKYVQTAERADLVRGSRPRDEVAWERLARAVVAQVGPIRQPGAATATLAPLHAYLAEHVGQVRQEMNVLLKSCGEKCATVASCARRTAPDQDRPQRVWRQASNPDSAVSGWDKERPWRKPAHRQPVGDRARPAVRGIADARLVALARADGEGARFWIPIPHVERRGLDSAYAHTHQGSVSCPSRAHGSLQTRSRAENRPSHH